MSEPARAEPATIDPSIPPTRPPALLTEEWRRRWREQPLHKFMDLDIHEQEQGHSRITMRTSERTLGGVGGSVHGGIVATLIDIACILAVASVVGPNEMMAGTAELNVSYLRPALGELVVTEGNVLKKGRSLAVVDVDCSDGKGRLFAKGRAQYAIRQR